MARLSRLESEMPKVWQLQEAKNRFSEVVDEALRDGPQVVTRRGRETVVVLSVEEYRRLASPEGSLVDFFRESPLRGVELERSSEVSREVKL